jgi:hypothetical protein
MGSRRNLRDLEDEIADARDANGVKKLEVWVNHAVTIHANMYD